MTHDHQDKVLFLTGAGGGIGRAIAARLAREGAKIVVTDVNLEAAQATVDDVTAHGGVAMAAQVDVRDTSQIAAAAEAASAAYGQIDYLVNNAGLVTQHSFHDLTEEAWDLVVDVNLKGQFLVAKAIVPYIAAAGGGAIVNLSTVEANVVVTSGSTAQPHYNASKGGVPMLTKALAVELAADSIRVNCVAPGPIETDFFDLATVTSDAGWEFMKQRLLIPRLGQPSDIAAATSFLLSEDAAFITGTQLAVDGGWQTR